MNIAYALQKITSQFWVIEGGKPDIISWLYRNNIDPKSIAEKHVIIDFVSDYRSFRINRDILEWVIDSLLKKERWRFVASLNTWIKL